MNVTKMSPLGRAAASMPEPRYVSVIRETVNDLKKQRHEANGVGMRPESAIAIVWGVCRTRPTRLRTKPVERRPNRPSVPRGTDRRRACPEFRVSIRLYSSALIVLICSARGRRARRPPPSAPLRPALLRVRCPARPSFSILGPSFFAVAY